MNKKQKRELIKIIISALIFILAFFMKNILFKGCSVSVFLSFGTIMLCGYKSIVRALKNIVRLNPLDEHFLMTVASIGAFFIGEPQEGAAVMLFYQVGELFESVAVSKSRREIKALLDIAPEHATVFKDGNYIEILPEEVRINDSLLIKPGERVPVDCIVTDGTSDIDTKAVTGEAIPLFASPGTQLTSGSVNLTGVIYAKALEEYKNSTVSKILKLTDAMSSKKSKYESFIHRFSIIYTPIVVGLAVLLAVVMPLFFGETLIWIKRALSFLVVSCPCALVISVPLAFFSGLGNASSNGILIKGSNYLEYLSRVDTAVFDKTGTLTTGGFYVTEINPEGVSKDELLMYASSAEAYSNHPVSHAIRNEFKGATVKVSQVKELAGMGVYAESDDGVLLAGNIKLMQEYGILCDEKRTEGIVVYIAKSGKFLGTVVVSDKIKENAYKSIKTIKKMGIKNVYILTGDKTSVAYAVAQEVGADFFMAELLPQDKVACMEKIMEEKNGTVMFCGDGINDAPVMAMADISFSMGQIGQDAALEASDVVLCDDNLEKIPMAIKISKKTVNTVRENIVFSLGIKILVMILTAFGVVGIWAAVFADVGALIIAILNSLRLLSKNLQIFR